MDGLLLSGGRWNYRNDKYRWGLDEVRYQETLKLLEALGEALHRIDYAECGDSSRDVEEPRVYDILLKVADELWL